MRRSGATLEHEHVHVHYAVIDGQRVERTEKRLEPFGMQRSIFGRAVAARGFVPRAIDGNTATSRRTNEPSRAFYCDREDERS